MILRTIIVDDEPLALDLLESVLSEHDCVDLIAKCGTGQEAVSIIQKLRPDLVFLDIEMPEMTGLEVAMTLIDKMTVSDMPQIVFATAYDRYAVQAFKVNAVDYVLKPINDEDVKDSLDRVKRILKGGQGHERTLNLRDTAVHSQAKLHDGEKIILVPFETLLSVQAQGDYVALHFEGKTRLIRSTLKAVEESLPTAFFIRVHRSSIVNLIAVREVIPAAKGASIAVLSDGSRVPVSRLYSKHIKSCLTD